MRLTVFDLDHTLLRINSSFHFGIYLYRQRCFSIVSMLCFLGHYLSHKFLKTSISKLHHQLFNKLFQGRSLPEIEAHVENFLDQHLTVNRYLPAVRRLEQALQRGDHTLILSSAPDFLVKAIARRFHVAHWKSTQYAVDDNLRFQKISEMIEGTQKADYITALAKEMGIEKKEITSYSDSHLDFPLLQASGVAVGVRPDKRLFRICQLNQWEVI